MTSPEPPTNAGNRPAPPTRAEAIEQTILAVDWGARRIGLAVKPAGQDWALPRQVLHVDTEAEGVDLLRKALHATGAQAVVVGLPIHPDPSQAQQIKRFCRRARRGVRGVRWFFVDERLTSEAAEARDLDPRRRRATDDLAAALILETFMQSLAEEEVV